MSNTSPSHPSFSSHQEGRDQDQGREGMIQAHFPDKLDILFLPHRYKVIYGGRGAGRCEKKGTKILMFDGSLQKIEDIVVGDLVMGPDSTPRKVLHTHQGTSPLYKVCQTSGEDYIVNDFHILSLKKSLSCDKDRGERMPSGNWRRPRGRYPNYPAICNIPIKEVLTKSPKWQENFRGYKAGLIHFKPKEVKIDPWLLGCWLGDGNARELRITTQDQEVIAACKKCAQAWDGDISICKKDNKAKDIGFKIRKGNKNPLWQEFLKYNLKNNKHIPQDYLANVEEVRLNMLAGFIDSDGYTNHNTYYISQVKENLSREIKYLADTLGFRTSLRRIEKFDKPHYTSGHLIQGGKRVIWQVSISGNAWRIPCRIGYKRLSRAAVKHNKDFLLSQISIKPYGEGEYAGIEVDGDHLYLLSDCTVTHNSWGCARALILKSLKDPLRILCAREVQRSIRDSVHKLISDQIVLLGVEKDFEILESVIRTSQGGEFTFSGLSTQTVESIKSTEGVDIVWCEEAQTITKRSWDILIPTIRKDGSEIWITFNPSLETDDTFQRFVVSPPPDTASVKLNYRDNPWFPAVLDQERRFCKINDPQGYPNIWEGLCKPAVEGAIYYNEVMEAERRGQICNVPYDPMLKVHIIVDLGWDDAMGIALIQKHASEIRIIEYIEDSHKTLDYYSSLLKKKGLNWGKVWLPHDGYSKDFKTGQSTAEILRRLKWDVVGREEIMEMSVEEGIRFTRMTFPRMYFDKQLAARPLRIVNTSQGHHRLLECAKRYRRKINKQTLLPGTPFHDAFSHGADCLRYIAVNAEQMTNEEEERRVYHEGYGTLDSVVGY